MITSFYINRTEDVDRKLYMKEALSSLPLISERVSAITLGKNRESRMKANTLSHQKAVKIAHDRNIYAALIMEDDCLFTEDFISGFDAIIETALSLPVDVVHFGGELNGPAKRYNDRFSITDRGVWGTHCYLVKSPAFVPILSKRSELAFDSVLMDAVRVVGIANEVLVYQADFTSTIWDEPYPQRKHQYEDSLIKYIHD